MYLESEGEWVHEFSKRGHKRLWFSVTIPIVPIPPIYELWLAINVWVPKSGIGFLQRIVPEPETLTAPLLSWKVISRVVTRGSKSSKECLGID